MGVQANDLEGRRFAALVVLERGPNALKADGSLKECQWWCRCDCGAETLVRAHHLRSGHTRSCGCRIRATVPDSASVVRKLPGSGLHLRLEREAA